MSCSIHFLILLVLPLFFGCADGFTSHVAKIALQHNSRVMNKAQTSLRQQQQPQQQTTASTTEEEKKTTTDSSVSTEQFISDFCRGTNDFWKGLVIKPVRDYVAIQPGGTARSDVLSKLIAPPEMPGIPRPVWFTILGSVPTALGWYGYYKFSVEEELYQYELQNGKPLTGCGGYGTLFPFVYGVIVGFPLALIGSPLGDLILQCAGAWILLGQVNLYRRVNELCTNTKEEGVAIEALEGEPPLHSWWALLPPPLDVVVGLRQVHFLSEFWRIKRGEEYDKDVVAEDLFPFISSPRFTLKEFVLTPSRWFWFTKEWQDYDDWKDFDLLQKK